MKSSTRSAAKSVRDVEYYRRRFQNRVFAKVVDFITTEAQREHITKKEMAERLGKDPGQLSRLLSQPSNLTLDTISDLLLAVDAEAEPPEIVRFKERRAPNYVHPLIARVTGKTAGRDEIRFPGQVSDGGSIQVEDPKMAAQPRPAAVTIKWNSSDSSVL